MKPNKHKRLKIFTAILIVLIVCYCVAVFSSIPFIAKWRTIYIETAMSTMTHQWLATSFIPKSVIDDVMQETLKQQQENLVDENNIEKPQHSLLWLGHPLGLSEEQIAERNFFETYKEIDKETLPLDITYKNLVITGENSLKTTNGDSIHTLDTVNGIVIINITGDGFVGKLCIIKDASKVRLEQSNQSYMGEHVLDITNSADCILGINASGFVDPNGKGNGGTPVGLVKSNGILIQDKINYGYWFNAGFDYENNLRIGTKVEVAELRDGVQFKPALIIDGEKKVNGSAGWGIQPRTVLGQTSNKEVLFLVIDGRKPGYSIGATVGDCADILLKYNATQAINLDGGSSSALVYNGQTINRPSTSGGNVDGRRVPNAWVVAKNKLN